MSFLWISKVNVVVFNVKCCAQIGHDGRTPGSGWYVKEVDVDMPTKGKNYHFDCDQWLAVDKGDGVTKQTFVCDSNSINSYKPRK